MFRNKLSGMLTKAFKLTGEGLTLKQKFSVALPGPILFIGAVLIHNVFIKFYTDIIGLKPSYVGWVYVIYNIWNAVNDPMLGAWLDRARGKPGRNKYMYIMRVTVPFMMLSAFAMALSSPSWSQWMIFAAYTAELFIYDTAATLYEVAYTAYTLEVAPTKQERLDVNILNNYISQALSAVVTMIPTLLLVGGGKREVIVPVFTVVIAAETVFFMLALKWLPAPPKTDLSEQPPQKWGETFRDAVGIIRSRPFLTFIVFNIVAMGPVRFYFTPYLYYMDHVLKADGGTATVVDLGTHIVSLLFLPLVGRVARRLGTKHSYYWGVLPAVLGFGGVFFANSVATFVIPYILLVFTVNYFQTVTSPMNGLIIDEDERVTGVRKVGMFNGLFALFIKAFSGLQTVVFTSIIGTFGYVGTAAAQSPEALFGIRVATALVPLAGVILGLLPMALYPFDKRKEEQISQYSNLMRRGNAGKEDEKECSI